jgi:hypothetical protein
MSAVPPDAAYPFQGLLARSSSVIVENDTVVSNDDLRILGHKSPEAASLI